MKSKKLPEDRQLCSRNHAAMCRQYAKSVWFALKLHTLASLEASAAVDRTIVFGNERDLGGSAALCADRVIHLALTAALILASIPAVPAANGLILEALLRVELLLTSGENEFRAAILANQYFVLEHETKSPLVILFALPIISADLVFDPTLADWKVRY